MAEPLRLLVVDDAPEHARMVEEFIRTGDAWPDARVRIAVSYDEALARLTDAAVRRRLLRLLARHARRPEPASRDPAEGDRDAGRRADQPRRRGGGGRGDEGRRRRLSQQGEPHRRGARTGDSACAGAARRGVAALAGRGGAPRQRRALPRARREQLRRAAADRRRRPHHLSQPLVGASSGLDARADGRPFDLRLPAPRRSRAGRRAHGRDARQPGHADRRAGAVPSRRWLVADHGRRRRQPPRRSGGRRHRRSTRATSPSGAGSRSSSARRRRWRRSASSPAASRTTSTIC